MAKRLTADELLPHVVGLSPHERARLLRLLTEHPDANEGAIYEAVPPRRDEFSTDEEPIAWEADGWEESD
jgi:hypothetical protein